MEDNYIYEGPKLNKVLIVDDLVDSGKTAEFVKKAYPKATFTNSICDASTRRQDSIKKISNNTDLIYIVGDANSNNSKTLYSLAKQMHKNISVKQIETAKDIKKKDLIGLSHIVIASGASTPKAVIESVKNKLLN